MNFEFRVLAVRMAFLLSFIRLQIDCLRFMRSFASGRAMRRSEEERQGESFSDVIERMLENRKTPAFIMGRFG
jgi:hypothetical protein